MLLLDGLDFVGWKSRDENRSILQLGDRMKHAKQEYIDFFTHMEQEEIP